jgi:hypothetical protein
MLNINTVHCSTTNLAEAPCPHTNYLWLQHLINPERLCEPTEETRVEEKQKEFLCALSWSVHHNLARDSYIESTCCCVKATFWDTLSRVMLYSALFINVFKALNLLLNDKSSCLAMVFGFFYRDLTCLALVINIRKCKEQRHGCSWQWLEAEHFCSSPVNGKGFKFLSQWKKHVSPHLFSS